MSPGHSDRSRLKQIGCAALVLIGLAVFVPRSASGFGHPTCVNTLSIPRDPQSRLDRDKKNPELAEAQLDVLRMQLQPHFLFNTLRAAMMLVHGDPDAFVNQFSEA